MKKTMNMKTLPLIAICALLISSTGCKKDAEDEAQDPLIPTIETGFVSDFEGNSYRTVKAGSQWWMAQDLRTTKLNNGVPIPVKTDINDWVNTPNPAMCYYENDTANGTTYGALYNYNAVSSEKICPVGWHVPTQEEWTALANTLGGNDIAGGKMKETGTAHWNNPNTGATNESKFTAVPSGSRTEQGYFGGLHNYSLWWTRTLYSTGAWARDATYGDIKSSQSCQALRSGLSIRCVRD